MYSKPELSPVSQRDVLMTLPVNMPKLSISMATQTKGVQQNDTAIVSALATPVSYMSKPPSSMCQFCHPSQAIVWASRACAAATSRQAIPPLQSSTLPSVHASFEAAATQPLSEYSPRFHWQAAALGLPVNPVAHVALTAKADSSNSSCCST